MKRIALTLILALIEMLTLPLASPSVMAGSQTWYLTDTTSGVPSGANYFMYRGSGNGSSDLAMSSGTSKVRVANETSNIVCRMSGSWSVTLVITAAAGGAKLTADIGYFSGSTFTSCGSSGSKSVSVGTMSFSVTTTSHTVSPGNYAAIKVSCTAKSFTLDLTGSPNSPSFVTSTSAADDYPGTEFISFTITDYGSNSINFGSLNPGITDQPADQTAGQGAVTLTMGTETNVNCNIQIKGTNFASGGNTIDIGKAKWGIDSNVSGATIMTTTYATITTSTAYTQKVQDVWHWLSIPAGQTAGNYISTFYYQAARQ